MRYPNFMTVSMLVMAAEDLLKASFREKVAYAYENGIINSNSMNINEEWLDEKIWMTTVKNNEWDEFYDFIDEQVRNDTY